MANGQKQIEKMIYHIRVKGNLDEKWNDWFEGFVMTSRDDGVTLLSGPAVDQAALYRVLNKIHGLGLSVLLVVKTKCPCSSKNCSRRAQCYDCVAFYRAKGELPYCFRARSKWNKQCMKLI